RVRQFEGPENPAPLSSNDRARALRARSAQWAIAYAAKPRTMPLPTRAKWQPQLFLSTQYDQENNASRMQQDVVVHSNQCADSKTSHIAQPRSRTKTPRSSEAFATIG